MEKGRERAGHGGGGTSLGQEFRDLVNDLEGWKMERERKDDVIR